MTVASEITRIKGNIEEAYTAASAKGATLPATENSDNLATCIGTITGSSPVITSLSVTPTTSAQTITAPSGTDGYSPVNVAAVTASIDANITAGNIKKDVTILGVTGTLDSSEPSGRYKLLDRIKDDSNNEIGTVSGFFTDANDIEYAVVCLDAQYRLASAAWSSSAGTVTNLTEYNMNGAVVDLIANTYTDTATSNCDKILAWCTAYGSTSEAVSHCRSKSFVIGGITYYGQLPNLCELFYICANRAEISNADISKSSYSSLDIATLASRIWSSSQFGGNYAWLINGGSGVNSNAKGGSCFVVPVLEIPNAI